MDITEITLADLPLFKIETFNAAKEEWGTFVHEPFKSLAEAEEHRQLILKEYPGANATHIRVSEYTAEDWRRDLITAVMADQDCLRRALSVLRNETLINVLK